MKPIAIRTLCEFTDRSGDIDLRYTPAPTALEGIEGHQRLQRKRGKHYIAEYPVNQQINGLNLRGRADGWDPSKQRVEEIKTFRGDLARQSIGQRTLHQAQLRTYGAMICTEQKLDKIHLRLTYLEVAKDEITTFDETVSAETLITELNTRVEQFKRWQTRRDDARKKRDAKLSTLQFAFKDFRKGQRELAEAVFKANRTARSMLIEAPTGSGKTLGTLYPALRAMPTDEIDCLFYLTTRNTARRIGLDGIDQLRAKNEIPLRVVEMVSKETGCVEPDRLCQGDSCPLAKGFFDRLPEARIDAFLLSDQNLDQERLRAIADQHKICPYFLGQEMTRWADVVVADINQYLAPTALLYAYLHQDDWRASAIIDEAHNLVSRCRDLYSIDLQQRQFKYETSDTKLNRALEATKRAWQQFFSDKPENPTFINYLPEKLEQALQTLCSELSEQLAKTPDQIDLQAMLFTASAYLKLAEPFGDHSTVRIAKPSRGKGEISILNLDPSPFLAQRWTALHSATLFSATLRPFDYYHQLLGLDDSTVTGSLPSPFLPGQIKLTINRNIDTRYIAREQSIDPIARVLIAQCKEHTGNHLFFSSSFSYLAKVEARVKELAPHIQIHPQRSGMTPRERQDYLERFTEQSELLGMAVLGGLFSEGVDLVGHRLIGVTVATLGLPPFDDFHEVMRQNFQERFNKGYEYTYLYPGIQKVAQAAGRLIRTTDDEGILTLIDPRFATKEIGDLLPTWWPKERQISDQ